jgi:hypothetical protein
MPPALGYDDISVFVNTFGGAYVVFGVQDVRFAGTQLLRSTAGVGWPRATIPRSMRMMTASPSASASMRMWQSITLGLVKD